MCCDGIQKSETPPISRIPHRPSPSTNLTLAAPPSPHSFVAADAIMTADPLFTYAAAMEAELAAAAEGANDPMDVDFDEQELRRHITDCSRELWGVPTLRPRQLETIVSLLDPRTDDHAVYVDGTGAGKSHAMHVLGGMLGGVSLIFIPLLNLSADVMAKFQTDNTDVGDVNVSHLDELRDLDTSAYRNVLMRISEMQCGSDSSHFVFYHRSSL